MELSVATFWELFPLLMRARRHDEKDQYVHGAFVGWQIQELIKGVVSEKPKPQRFFDYLKQFGLTEENANTKPSAEARKEEAARNIALAQRIRAADLGRG